MNDLSGYRQCDGLNKNGPHRFISECLGSSLGGIVLLGIGPGALSPCQAPPAACLASEDL